MKKLFLLFAASFMLFACGGNNYTEKLDAALEAMRAGNVEEGMEMMAEYSEYLLTLSADERKEATAAWEEWYLENQPEITSLILSQGEAAFEGIGEGLEEAYEEVADMYGDEIEEAVERATELAEEATERATELAEEAVKAAEKAAEDAVKAAEEALSGLF